MRAFGDSARQQLESNDYGVIILGHDNDELPHISLQLTQVFRSGEICGLDRSLIEPVRTNPRRSIRIPWPATELRFRQTLADYIDFGRDVLELPLPVTLVAGLAMVRDDEFIAEKAKWFVNAPKRTRCFQETIRHEVTLSHWDVPQGQLLDPFFKVLIGGVRSRLRPVAGTFLAEYLSGNLTRVTSRFPIVASLAGAPRPDA